MNVAFSLLSGLIFGLGLIISGMTSPDKVIGFLDVKAIADGAWQWDLAGVMGGALLTHALIRFFILKKEAPLLGGSFPSFKNELDQRLLIGAALFGLGWGTAGFCPGPGIVSALSLTEGAQSALTFVGAMLVGMFAARLFEPKQS
jgi:uncharacterized membrane protein YedE/YeeE